MYSGPRDLADRPLPDDGGAWRNGIPLPGDSTTIAHHFGAAGYETAYIGKWHLGDPAVRRTGRPALPGRLRLLARGQPLEHTSDAYDTILYDGDGARVKLPGYRVDAVTDAAIRYLAVPREQPFFLFVSLLEPHHQNRRDDYPAPEGYAERYRGAWTPPDLATPRWYGAPAVARVLRDGQADRRGVRTVAGGNDQSRTARRHDRAVHLRPREPLQDPQRRVQAVRPRGVDPGADGGDGRGLHRRRSGDQLISHVDLLPTLLDAAGLPVPEELQGRSVVPCCAIAPRTGPTTSSCRSVSPETARAVAPGGGSTA